MKITSAEFIVSNLEPARCPPAALPEYAFIGRSNVGKSSLINMLAGKDKLAKTSSTPGKTQMINHFLINDRWYLVDLPGYGYAKVPGAVRDKFEGMINEYILHRKNLMCVFVLVDSRHEPQKIDREFMRWLGENRIRFVIVFTKTDKLKPAQKKAFLQIYESVMLEDWEEMPVHFITSAIHDLGRKEMLAYIDKVNALFRATPKAGGN